MSGHMRHMRLRWIGGLTVSAVLVLAIALGSRGLRDFDPALTHFAFASVVAAFAVALLLYLPFGKLFHVFQRPAQLGVGLYKRVGAAGPAAHCARCGEKFASAMHVEDLKAVLTMLGIGPRFAGFPLHYQDICPGCRRRLVAIQQARLMGR